MNVSPGPDLHFLYSGLTYCHKTSGAYRLKPARQTATQEMREAEKRMETFVSRLFHSNCQRLCQSMLNAALAGVEIAPFLVGPRKKIYYSSELSKYLQATTIKGWTLIIQTQTRQIRGIP